MSLISLILILAIIGVVLYGVTTLVPMDPLFRNLIYLIVVLFLLLYLLQVFGSGDLGQIRIR